MAQPTPHAFLTISVPFEDYWLKDVRDKLTKHGRETRHDGDIREALRDRDVHFLSLSAIEHGRQCYLVLEASVDGTEDHALETIADGLSDTLTDILRTARVTPVGTLTDYLRSKIVRTGVGWSNTPGLNFCGTPGMSVARIKAEASFANSVRELLVQGPGSAGAQHSPSPLDILKSVRSHFAAQPEHAKMMLQDDFSMLDPPPAPVGRLAFLVNLVSAAFTGPFWFIGLAVIAAGAFAAWKAGAEAGLWFLLYLAIVLVVSVWASHSPVVWTVKRPLIALVIAAPPALAHYFQISGPFWFSGAMLLVGLLAALAFTAIVMALTYSEFRRREGSDKADNSAPNPQTMREISDVENDGDNNHLFAVSVIKPGFLRKISLRLAFWLIQYMARTKFRPGHLGDLGTIHFARWVQLPGTDKLLFMSNYGGSWESYLEDFVTKASTGLTGVWSNTVGFPRTENLVLAGAADGDRFKRWARRQQLPSHFWYAAYPNTTTRLIRTNTSIRRGLLNATTEDAAADWLALFGSRRRGSSLIETHEIQSIMFGGMGMLGDATCLLLRLPDNQQEARGWLRELQEKLSFGDEPPVDSARIVAFTRSGLSALGLSEKYISEFSTAFNEGMTTSSRADRILGDTGDDCPVTWLWGNSDKRVDVALIVYAHHGDGTSSIDTELDEEVQRAKRFNVSEVYSVNMATVDDTRPVVEPFGFVDNISQPIIKGSRKWVGNQNSQHVVAPGELILGYPDNRGFLPTTPTVRSSADRKNILPGYRQTASDDEWYGAKSDATSRKDFGRNGSYLVIRHLEQDVDLFNATVADLSNSLNSSPALPSTLTTPDKRQLWIEAKMVGRWRDGSSLVRNPYKPGGGWPDPQKLPAAGSGSNPPAQPQPPDSENEFLFGLEDPSGFRCPFSAHIRRANPRDSFNPGSQAELSIINRHRILRIGRSYNEGGGYDLKKPGLMFMCLNADIERQFEFIQQTWVMSRLFHGLTSEVDSILGRGGKGGKLTIPSPKGYIQLKEFKDFVKVRGGGYFFMPSRSAIRFLTER